jgi:deoxyribodipyrimidine photo-lyase
MDDTPMTTDAEPFRAEREEALARLDRFLPAAGRDYAAGRNFDHGPGRRGNLSGLSPWLRRRLVSEAEVASRVVRAHGEAGAEKFLQEVLWRTYWKGWLELRPGIWRDYLTELSGLKAGAGGDPNLAPRLRQAEEGRTGIDGFDDWARELVTTGYLHNHARMWFASIWIFTLGLPWQLGADFFFRHLLDGDPASNTLSWRWVAGLHTRGKHYVARAANIRRYTDGRHDPGRRLNESPDPLPWTPPPEPVPPEPLAGEPAGGPATGLLVLGDDCAPEGSGLGGLPLSAVAAGWPGALGLRWRLAPAVADFTRGALADALRRASAHWHAPATGLDESRWIESLLGWCHGHGLARVVMIRPALGPWQEVAGRAAVALAAAGADVVWVRRRWDTDLWPAARGGFFGFWKSASKVLGRLDRYV